MSINTFILKQKTAKFKKYLKNINLDKFKTQSEQKAISIFKRAAKNIPAYRAMLDETLKANPEKISNISDFRRFVPIVDKQKIFSSFQGQIDKLCIGGSVDKVKEIIPSSGYLGNFSFGLISQIEQKQFREFSDVMLDYTFNIADKKTLLINTFAMGIKIHSDYVVCADTGPRSDTVISLLKEFSPKFEQIIIAGDNNFIKNTLEEAKDASINLEKPKIHLILGEEILAENLRAYLAYLLGEDLSHNDCAFLGSSFGIAELGLNLMFETKETIALRRKIQKDNSQDVPPALFQYFPTRVYIEEYNKEDDPKLLMTNLEENAILPLIRYNTKDCGKFIQPEGKFLLNLPVISIYGRDKFLASSGKIIRPELIKEALFSDFDIAASITGYFRISESDAKLKVELQLKKEKNQAESLKSKIENTLSSFLKTPCQVKTYPYYSFPYGMESDYERKFRYI